MGYLFLSGGGNTEETEKIDKEFIKQINPSKSLLYIPIALKSVIPYEDCFKWINGALNPMGIQNITMWTDLNNKSLDELNQFSAIYIGGGNTFSLLNDLRNSKFDEVLKEYIQNEGIVYGGSAGAIIFGANIMTCAHMDPNNVGVQNYDGLNLISNNSIWCHYQEENDLLIKNHVKDLKKPVIALSEETGIILCKDGVKVIGNTPAYVFESETKRKIQPEDFV